VGGLDADPESLRTEINALLEGSLRAIVATMTVEDLNNNRESLSRGVLDEAGDSLSNIGMEVDAFKIQSIADDNGYLAALGQARIAEVKRDADIATAEATRDGRIRAAQASQQAEVAEAQAAVITAEAQRERDIKIAQNAAIVNAEQAKADQAGPLAEAEAKRAVGVAEEQAEAARVEARIEVERRRSEQAQQTLQADVIAPAEAARTAQIARAEGARQETILAGEAAAEARKASADALRAEQQAEADGIAAKLKAEAEGKADIAEALNASTPEAARLLMMPDILQAIVNATAAAAEPVGNIDKVVMFGSGDNSQGGVAGFANSVPLLLAQGLEALKASGVDIPALLSGTASSTETTATSKGSSSES
jgi:flotillin